MHIEPLQNAPVLYVAPRHEHAMVHALKRIWVALMLRRGAKRARAQGVPPEGLEP